MIQQPELGKRIADYRKLKGFTQEDLVEQCNLSVRTLQRIEAGEVTPRIHTIRLILEVLGLDYEESLISQNGNIKGWKKRFYINLIDLFNLKTHPLRKISILSVAVIISAMAITYLSGEIFTQSDSKVKKIIDKNNSDFVIWFNNGDISSLVDLYHDDACLVSRGCGKDFIRSYYNIESGKFKFSEIKATSISVSDTIAVEKGTWSAILNSGIAVDGKYLTEWKITNKKWLIVSELSGLPMN